MEYSYMFEQEDPTTGDEWKEKITHCRECSERLGESPRAEVYLDVDTIKFLAGGQWVMVDDIPDEAFGPFLVHQDPCALVKNQGLPKYSLA